MPTQVILDGRLISKNLKEVGISKMWLLKELRKKNIKKISNVIYAEITNDGSLFVDTK